jgi:hypothetical protein
MSIIRKFTVSERDLTFWTRFLFLACHSFLNRHYDIHLEIMNRLTHKYFEIVIWASSQHYRLREEERRIINEGVKSIQEKELNQGEVLFK